MYPTTPTLTFTFALTYHMTSGLLFDSRLETENIVTFDTCPTNQKFKTL